MTGNHTASNSNPRVTMRLTKQGRVTTSAITATTSRTRQHAGSSVSFALATDAGSDAYASREDAWADTQPRLAVAAQGG